MTFTNRNKATITLGLVSLGFVASHPFAHTFAGGLLASGCSAAMVGGLADWFAVSALFRRPLGIPFRTELIPRNRERITTAIIAMVEDELLTCENIRATVSRYDLAALVVRYLADYDGKSRISEFLVKIGDDTIAQLNPDKIGRFLADILRANADQVEVAPLLAQAVEWSVDHYYADNLADFLIDELAALIIQPQVGELLAGIVAEARAAYERDMRRRQFASQFLEGLGFTAADMAAIIQREGTAFLHGLKDRNHPWRAALRREALVFAARLRDDPAFKHQVEEAKNKWLAGYPDLAGHLSAFVAAIQQAAAGEPGRAVVRRWVGTQVSRMVNGFQENKNQQQAVAQLFRRALMAFIDTHHAHIGKIVRERLEQYSTGDLVEFIESRVGNDLQMIRINGSVVGGLAGMLFFLLTYWW
jgi:Predicted membrane protein